MESLGLLLVTKRYSTSRGGARLIQYHHVALLSALNERILQLKQVLPLANTFTKVFMQKHACFFHKMPDLSFTIRIFEEAWRELVDLTAGEVCTSPSFGLPASNLPQFHLAAGSKLIAPTDLIVYCTHFFISLIVTIHMIHVKFR